jgi:Cys-tRNA(Pro)/Cys-tRNA(Cys) deacylase
MTRRGRGRFASAAKREPDRITTQALAIPALPVIDEPSPHMKTNAARLLDSLGISYEIREYEVDPDDLAAESVARKVGLPPEQVFKTLVARGDKHGVCFAVVPGDQQLDLKALATLTGDKKIDTVSLKEVQPLTGYIRGGVTALAAKKLYPVYADETIELFDVISISSGMRGAQLILSPADYLLATNAKTGAIAKEK